PGRFLVPGPRLQSRAVAEARDARLELVVSSDEIPEGVRCHVKLDTGMGRYGLSELPTPTRDVVGVMSHLATADSDARFAEQQIERFARATAGSGLTRHIANSAGALRYPSARFDAARCGIALYGLSPFGEEPARDGLEPVLRWESHLAQVKRLAPGESTGYGRRFVAERETWIGLVPVGYADGFRRSLTGATVRVAGEPRQVVGTISMDSFAVELDRELPIGTPVVLLGGGVSAEDHARIAGTINYELVTGISSDPRRARRTVDFTPLAHGIDADLLSRDFTINAIAVPLEAGEPYDPSGGREDLELRSIRAVTDTIFEDDPLRLLRAVRLEDELGFHIAPLTEELIREHAGPADRPSGERIPAE